MTTEQEDPHGIVRVGLRLSAALVAGDGERLVLEVAEHIERAGLKVSLMALSRLLDAAERQRR